VHAVTNNARKAAVLIPAAMLIGALLFYFLFPGAVFRLLIAAERSAAGLTPHQIVADGWRISYLAGGKGDTLLLLHGFGANKDNWTRIGRFLTPRIRLIAPDLPGFGESDADPQADYSISAQVKRLKAFVAVLGLQSFHLGGSSMGGTIAAAYAATYPEEVKSLLLLAPGGVASAQPSEMFRLLEQGKPNPLVAESPQDYDALLDFVFVKRPFIPRAIKKHLARQAAAQAPTYRKIFQQLVNSRRESSLEAAVSGLAIPTLIVWGAGDRVLHVSGAAILAALMPEATAAIMDGVGHLPMIEKPEETARIYLRFMDRLSAAQ